MLGRTHFLFGIFLGLIYYLYGAPLYVLFIIPILSLLMDVDEKHSYVGRRLKFIASLFSHRGFFHSVWFVLLSFLIAATLNPFVAYSVLIAYFGHLLLDGISKAGINPFWPIKFKLKGPIRVGKWEEHVFLIIIVAGIIFLLA
jgi:membrane-bound metal-dependent hydrolase YbcI (DUF457 family)